MKNPVNILKTTLSLLLVLVWFTHAHANCLAVQANINMPIAAIVFPANVTMQVTGTDCTPWCETVVEDSPAPSSTVNALSFAPATPTIAGVPISPVNNPGTCNGVCVGVSPV